MVFFLWLWPADLAPERIILRQHSLSEVIVGFLVGLVCGIAGILFI